MEATLEATHNLYAFTQHVTNPDWLIATRLIDSATICSGNILGFLEYHAALYPIVHVEDMQGGRHSLFAPPDQHKLLTYALGTFMCAIIVSAPM